MVSSDRIIKIGTRGSRLALRQSQIAVDLLKQHWTKREFQIHPLSSMGDLDPEGDFKELSQKAGKGVFTKALDEALLQKRIDVAVHSLKDLPIELVEGIQLGAVLQREDPRDVWISRDKQPLTCLAPGAVVGTSSVRRAAQLKYRRKDLKIVPLRGNIDTRIKKLRQGNGNEGMDGIVIALAGVRRAELENQVTEILPLDVMLPAVGQGAIALVIRTEDGEIKERVAQLDDSGTRIEIEVERTFLEKLGGGCHVPIAGVAQLDDAGGVVTLQGGIFSPDGSHCLRAVLSAPRVEGKRMAERLAEMLLSQGGGKILFNEPNPHEKIA